MTPRTLSARYLGNLVCCEGIVTKCEFINAGFLTGFFCWRSEFWVSRPVHVKQTACKAHPLGEFEGMPPGPPRVFQGRALESVV